jgi:hypothetical protein
VDRAAARINAHYPNGLDAHHIAATIPNDKDPLIIMFEKDGEGEYAYDQGYYDGFQGHRPRRRGEEAACAGEKGRKRSRV